MFLKYRTSKQVGNNYINVAYNLKSNKAASITLIYHQVKINNEYCTKR